MLPELSSSLSEDFFIFRIAWVLAGLAGLALLWRRPRPGYAFALVLLLNLAAWAACVAPLGRLYALEEHLDRSFNVGMAACAAAGNSPFEHLQVRHGSLEPFWNMLVAALALFRPERVLGVYHWLAPLSVLAVAAGVYYGLRQNAEEIHAWERVLIVFAALLLSSFWFTRAPILPFWSGNFLLKPNHASAWALVAVALGMMGRRLRPWRLGLLMGLLAWVFILAWAYLAFGLFLAMLLRPRTSREWRALIAAGAISAVIAAPYIFHLWRHYSPLDPGETSGQMWRDGLGASLTAPYRVTLDMAPLFVLGVLGAIALWRRSAPLDQALLGLLGSAWALWLAFLIGSRFGFSPEPDEHHYFLRFAMGLAAGAGLAEMARRLAAAHGLAIGRAHLLLMAVTLPLAFPAHWNPPTMDRYYRWCQPPLRAKVLQYGKWVRENTRPKDVFAAGRSASIWIPVLAGRQVLLTDESRPPSDLTARRKVEHVLLTWETEADVRAAAAQYGITHVAVDEHWVARYGEDAMKALAQRPFYQQVYASTAVRILRLREPGAPPR
jgi:hypothetical protein